MLGQDRLGPAVAALNATAASVAAVLPDRVPLVQRATLSAVIGVAILLATAIGTVLGSVFLADTGRGLRSSPCSPSGWVF